MKQIYLLAFAAFLFSCKKEDVNCEAIQSATAGPNISVTLGDSIKLSTNDIAGGNVHYSWQGPAGFSVKSARAIIKEAELKNEGWYYLFVTGSLCTKVDSVYVDVKLKQGNPGCTIAANKCEFYNLPTQTFTSVKRLAATANQSFTLQCLGTAPLNIRFHNYWNTHEPEDGIYETVPTPEFIPDFYNRVYITTTINNVLYTSSRELKLYVSHINGKLQVRFCILYMLGFPGDRANISASANIIEQ